MRAADRRRALRLASARLEPDETITAVTRAWVSRRGRLGAVSSLRVRHVVVATDLRVMMFSVGFWTRRPKRRVYTTRRDSITAHEIIGGRGSRRCVHLDRPGAPPLLIDLGRGLDAAAVTRALVGGDQVPEPAEDAPLGAGPNAADDTERPSPESSDDPPDATPPAEHTA